MMDEKTRIDMIAEVAELTDRYAAQLQAIGRRYGAETIVAESVKDIRDMVLAVRTQIATNVQRS